jgi:hypothetical protein
MSSCETDGSIMYKLWESEASKLLKYFSLFGGLSNNAIHIFNLLGCDARNMSFDVV